MTGNEIALGIIILLIIIQLIVVAIWSHNYRKAQGW